LAAAGAQTPSAAILPLRSGEQDTTAILCLIGNYPFTFNAPSFQRFLADAALQINNALRLKKKALALINVVCIVGYWSLVGSLWCISQSSICFLGLYSES
jgi:hypothetical protein